MSDTITLAAKICKAALEVGGKLAPDKRNKEQGYDYISADKMLAECGQALATAGVTVFPSITETAIVEVPRQGKGPRYDARVTLAFTVTDGVESFSCLWTGMGSDYTVPDKAIYKAITSGHKYFLTKLLNVGAGNEDGENEPREEEAQPAKKPAPAPTKTNGKPAQPPPPDDGPGDADMVGVGQSLGGQIKMALETALNVETSDGVKYGTIPSERLSHMSGSLAKKLKAGEIPPDERETAQMKLDAIATILAHRAAAQPN